MIDSEFLAAITNKVDAILADLHQMQADCSDIRASIHRTSDIFDRMERRQDEMISCLRRIAE